MIGLKNQCDNLDSFAVSVYSSEHFFAISHKKTIEINPSADFTRVTAEGILLFAVIEKEAEV